MYNAKLEGVLIKPMLKYGTEMIIGVNNDRDFGPMIMVGMGGVFVELFKDVALAPAPLTGKQAMDINIFWQWNHPLPVRTQLLGKATAIHNRRSAEVQPKIRDRCLTRLIRLQPCLIRQGIRSQIEKEPGLFSCGIYISIGIKI